MITINLKELALRTKTERWPDGVDSSYKLRLQCPLVETGKLLSSSIISQLWHGNMQKIGLGTVEAICVGLDCGPSDWIIVSSPRASKKGNGAKRL